MKYQYTVERNIQIVIYLLKQHGIKRIVTSPGATDVSINISLQHDPYFELYSCVDERSAAYMACGMAAESGEPVALTCTGATSSRNYMPGMTEAYYRHLPVLAITCCRSVSAVGHYVNQVTDRSNLPNDVANISVHCQSIHCPDDEWDCMVKANKAMLGLKWNGGGPCHINLETIYAKDFSASELPPTRVIKRYTHLDELPRIPEGKIGIFVGAHSRWDMNLTDAVERFCKKYGAAVFCDHTSNYRGPYEVLFPLITDQFDAKFASNDLDLVIHIGYISNALFSAKEFWRVNEDGEIRDTFKKMTKVFQMTELEFFEHYAGLDVVERPNISDEWKSNYASLLTQIPELPFSNLWVARNLSSRLPDNSVLHLGIRNSIRSWSYFDIPNSVETYCNTGGFGIDGGVSSLIGASFVHRDKLFFGAFGDLLFFYDMNSIGNRDIQSNVRILIVNNGLGQEFKNYSCYSSIFGEETDRFIAARGHYGQQSRTLIKNFSEALGFEYLSSSSKEEFQNTAERFVTTEHCDNPMLFEIFTDTDLENEALRLLTTLSTKSKLMSKADDILSTPELTKVRSTIKKIVK